MISPTLGARPSEQQVLAGAGDAVDLSRQLGPVVPTRGVHGEAAFGGLDGGRQHIGERACVPWSLSSVAQPSMAPGTVTACGDSSRSS